MAKKSLPPRDSKGRFVSKNKSSRSRSSKKNLPPRDPRTGRFVSKRSYRMNPVGGDVVGMLMGGTVAAGQVLVGKAAARSIPDLAGLPKEGNTGLAIQAAVAVGLGWVADQFLSPQAAREILAGGLTAPLETMIVAFNVPWFSQALSPVTAGEDLGAYVRARRPRRRVSGQGNANGGGNGGMGRYVPPGSGGAGSGSMTGVGSYAAY